MGKGLGQTRAGQSRGLLKTFRTLDVRQDRDGPIRQKTHDRPIGLENSHAISRIHQGKRLLSMLSRHEFQVLLIGDTLHDAEAAEAMHVDCVLVAHSQSKQRLKQSGAPVVDSLRDLFESSKNDRTAGLVK